MKISVMTYAFGTEFGRGGWSVRDFVECCARMGVDGVELSSHLMKELSDDEVRLMVEEFGLEFPVYIAHTDFVVRGDAEFNRAVQVAKEEVDRARRLDVPIVMLVPGSPKADIPDDTGRALIARGLAILSEYGRDIGVNVTHENHGGQAAFRGRLDQMRYFVNEAPLMGITLDDGNFLLAGDDPHEALDVFYDRLAHVHLKDLKAVPAASDARFPVPGRPGFAYAGALLGTGEVDTGRLLRSLAERGYDGYLSIENFGLSGEESVRASIDFIRSVLG